jgi:uncharacterized protein
MFRLLLLIAVIALAVFLLKKLYLDNKNTRDSSGDDKPLGLMQKCAQCELHLPKEQGLTHQDIFFCCAQHRDAYFSK